MAITITDYKYFVMNLYIDSYICIYTISKRLITNILYVTLYCIIIMISRFLNQIKKVREIRRKK
jgi:hypothetical protein